MKYIKRFTEICKKDTDIAGGKGASLGEMMNAGIPVPDGYVVTSNTFDLFLRQTGLNKKICALLDAFDYHAGSSPEGVSENIQKLIKEESVPGHILKEITKVFTDMNMSCVAVRSSATVEDGVDHAWAGQLESYLNVDEKGLVEKVKYCWASLFTSRAIQYRFDSGLAHTHISVAVVVQKMINSEKSGVAFSAHPVTEDKNQIVIEAGLGLGEPLVSGAITPDLYVMEKNTQQILDLKVNRQKKALYGNKEEGNIWVVLDEVESSTQVLSKKEILVLGELVQKIEDHYGFPCDVEWTFASGEFFIVQSRPITTLSKNKKESTVLWEKVLQRNFPPLGWTAGAYYEFNGLSVGSVHWIRDREMQIKYKVEQSYMIQDPGAYYTSNIKDFIQKIHPELEKSIDEENSKIMKMVDVLPGKTHHELKRLNAQHKLSYGLMLLGFDVLIDIKEKIDETIGNKSLDFELYLTVPWRSTAIQREQAALEEVRKELLENPHKKENLLEKLELDFGYIHQDYLGKPWGKSDYEKALADSDTFHSAMVENFDDSSFSQYEKWLIVMFKKMTYMYEEGRNAMVRCAWAMKLTVERMGHNPYYLLYMTASEVDDFCDGKIEYITKELYLKRKDAFALHFDDGAYIEYSGNEEVEKLIHDQGVQNFWEVVSESFNELSGSVAYKGYARGRARIVYTQEDSHKIKEGEILVSPMTQVEFLSGIRKCAAIVTDEGGIICHAAIVSREFGKPCILGTGKATQVIKTGDMIEVDANNGIVRLIKK